MWSVEHTMVSHSFVFIFDPSSNYCVLVSDIDISTCHVMFVFPISFILFHHNKNHNTLIDYKCILLLYSFYFAAYTLFLPRVNVKFIQENFKIKLTGLTRLNIHRL